MIVLRRLGLSLASTVLAAGAFLVIAPASADKPKNVLPGAIATSVSVIPIAFDRNNPDRTRFDKLVFRSGLNLFAKSRHFGGYSGLALDASGTQLLAVSDAGTWMKATLDYDGRKLKGLNDVVMGPILAEGGRPLRTDKERDSESLALASGDTKAGTAYVSFEGDQRILRYPFTAKSFGPPDGSVPLPKAAMHMGANRGIEAMALIAAGPLKGTLIAFSERLFDGKGNLRGWLIGGPTPGPITLKPIAGFDITDAAPMPDGGLVLLERRFRYSEGIKMRIRRIAARDIKRGAVLSGEVLLEAHDNLNIDNMEAIATYQTGSGQTIITLMSDDNFSPLQRTLIMQFVLPEETRVKAEARGIR